MRSPFHRAPSQETALESAIAQVKAEFEPGHFATIEASLLRPTEAGEQRTGTKPLYVLVDAEERRYALKLGLPELMAAERAAYELRCLGGRPCVPTRIVELTLPELGAVSGLLKPFVDFDGSRELGMDTSSWTELQRTIVLLEHAWEWFLDNSDTNTTQYALVGPDAYPLNIDWDRSFASEATSEFSRYDKYKVLLPNARTFLYSDYVEGKVDLPFSVLLREAARIRRLPAERVRRIVERYARARYTEPAQAEIFVRRMLERQRNIEREAKRFVRELLRERIELSVAPSHTPAARFDQALTRAWNQRQKVLNAVARGPLGLWGRRALRYVRGKRWDTGPRSEATG